MSFTLTFEAKQKSALKSALIVISKVIVRIGCDWSQIKSGHTIGRNSHLIFSNNLFLDDLNSIKFPRRKNVLKNTQGLTRMEKTVQHPIRRNSQLPQGLRKATAMDFDFSHGSSNNCTSWKITLGASRRTKLLTTLTMVVHALGFWYYSHSWALCSRITLAIVVEQFQSAKTNIFSRDQRAGEYFANTGRQIFDLFLFGQWICETRLIMLGKRNLWLQLARNKGHL